jgi:hypothetical protein
LLPVRAHFLSSLDFRLQLLHRPGNRRALQEVNNKMARIIFRCLWKWICFDDRYPLSRLRFSDAAMLRKSDIATIFRPPTLIPRKSAI